MKKLRYTNTDAQWQEIYWPHVSAEPLVYNAIYTIDNSAFVRHLLTTGCWQEVEDKPVAAVGKPPVGETELRTIKGVGLKTARILAEAGIVTLTDFAILSPQAIDDMLDGALDYIKRDDILNWQAQARTMIGDN